MSWLAAIGGALLLGVGVPWLGIRMLIPTLERGRLAANYRGREVFMGLGIAWLLWAGTAIVGGVVISGVLASTVSDDGVGSAVQVLTLAGPLALVAFALGIVDDAYGSPDARGFGGHLRALSRGRLTTGGLKLIGISAASFVVGLILAAWAPWGTGRWNLSPTHVGVALIAGAAIALTSNFVNLTDLRPGRALKVYTVLSVFGVVSTAVFLPWLSGGPALASGSTARIVDALAVLAFAMGPVVATWRYDLGERGMLGDAGANAMGAVAGMLIVTGLPLWGLLIYLAVVLALNVISERVSFSRVIEGNSALRWFDELGRLPAEDSLACGAK